MPFQPRSDRVPLRDVQNELLNLQDSPTLMLKHASMHERDPKTKVWRHSFTAFRSLCLLNFLGFQVRMEKNIRNFADTLTSAEICCFPPA